MSDQLVQLEVRILLLKHSRQKVLRALGQLGDQTPDQIEQQIQAMEQKRRSRRTKPTVVELAAKEAKGREEIEEPLRTLAVAFENKTFMPQLRDIQRFLDQAAPTGKLRSRKAAAPALFRALANLPKEELDQLATTDDAPGESDYQLLAQAIMGTSEREGEKTQKSSGPQSSPSGE